MKLVALGWLSMGLVMLGAELWAAQKIHPRIRFTWRRAAVVVTFAPLTVVAGIGMLAGWAGDHLARLSSWVVAVVEGRARIREAKEGK